jgi:murein DD-endopeptidase MepM/ murein hydrolase activator NlpD
MPAMVAFALVATPGSASTANVFAPIDARVPVPPRALVAGGQTSLVYEIHVTNSSSQSLTLEAVDVMDRAAVESAPPLLHLQGSAVAEASRLIGEPLESAETSVIPAGRTAAVFVWVALGSGEVPAALTHRFTIKMSGKDAATVIIPGVDVPVSARKAPVIGPPLEGDHWLAGNGPDNGTGHRRALISLTGEARIAQRFAIDWVRLFENGRTYQGDPHENASYRAFGAKVLAVGDGVVLETVDGVPENIPDPVARAVPITPATVSGNYILLDLGGDAYAVYAHLQPGSLRVKKGDPVRRGQTLALVGNTGNSTEPHLHFHIADRPSALDSEGIPYAFSSFSVEAGPQAITPALRPLGGSLEIGPSGLAVWKGTAPGHREAEMPLLNMIVTFPGR